MYHEINAYIRSLPRVTAKDLLSRISYWRSDGTRFCKLEIVRGIPAVTFTDLKFDDVRAKYSGFEPDSDGRARILISNAKTFDQIKSLIRQRST